MTLKACEEMQRPDDILRFYLPIAMISMGGDNTITLYNVTNGIVIEHTTLPVA